MLRYIVREHTPARNIPELIAAHEDAVRRLKDLLPIACERDGHQWSEPVRGRICTNEGLYEKNDDHDGKFGTASGWWVRKPEYRDVFSRTCFICGKKESKDTIFEVVNPFVSRKGEE